MSETFPVVSDAEHREPLAQASYKFIYAQHTLENMGEINDHLEDADVIAFEPFHADDEAERSAVETAMNRALATDASDADKQAAFALLREHDNGALPDRVLERFAGSGKSFALIDITVDHSEYESLDEAYTANVSALSSGFDHVTSNAELQLLAAQHIVAAADHVSIREKIMVDRLRQLGQEHPGKQIGVLIGAVHTTVGDAIGTQGAEISEVLVMGGVDSRLSYENEAIRTMVAQNNRQLDQQTLNKMLLQEYFSYYAEPKRLEVPDLVAPEARAAKSINTLGLQDDLIDLMTPEQVATVLAELESVRFEHGAESHKILSRHVELHNKVNYRLNQLIEVHAVPQQNRPDNRGGDVLA
jgi:hypothetical protein